MRKTAAGPEPAAARPEAESAEAQAAISEAGLVYVTDAQPGFGRRRAGKGFVYCDARGKPEPGAMWRVDGSASGARSRAE